MHAIIKVYIQIIVVSELHHKDTKKYTYDYFHGCLFIPRQQPFTGYLTSITYTPSNRHLSFIYLTFEMLCIFSSTNV
jgi:hypothetical protein